MMIRLIVGALFFILSLFLKDNMKIILSLLAYIVLGYDVILKAIKNIGRGQIFDENFLMTVATIAAIYLQDYSEAAGVMLFYQIGEYFQDLAVRRSRKSIAELMNIRSEHATVIREGQERIVHPEEVDVGEIIYVKAGEKVPLDGVILEGKSRLNMASLTGESLPKDVEEGDEILSGSVNESGLLKVRVNKPYSDSTVMKILELIENSENKKASHEAFITKFAKYYTPIVVLAAIFTAIISAIVLKDIQEGIRRACTFLVISCPCALVISVPLSFFAGIGGLSKKGILVKGADIIEKLAVIKEVIFDKTGTITNGEFEVSEIVGKDKEKILEYAAMVEQYSHHPLSLAIEKVYTKNTFPYDAKDIQEIAGRGMVAMIEEKKVYVGNQKLMLENGIKDIVDTKGTVIHVAIEDEYLGYISLKDGLKKGMTSVIDQLKNMNITTAMVSGDTKEIVEEIRQEVGIEKAVGECLPEDKVRYIQKRKEECKVAFVGDGVNDAPVLVEADVGLSMGAIGSDAAIEASDVVLMDDDITKVKMAIDNSRRIVAVAKQNIYGAILIKVITLILGAFGIANMWMAIFADTGVALLCVLNALRLLNAKE
ncbi:MAG: cadmium-translocating P-type ATPase [Solobacterium sp.]|nr:cadmium-translocating P-type ATPase [Solobacterium sp.]